VWSHGAGCEGSIIGIAKKILTKTFSRNLYSLFRVSKSCQKAKLHPYRVSIVQESLPTDLEKLVRHCLWFQRLVWEHPGIFDITWITDEAWFHLSGYINSQNTRVWAEENPYEIHTEPLHSEKIGVWCALFRRRNIGPKFFHQIVTTEVFLNLFSEFVNQLIDNELTEGYFQQDGATCHTSNASLRKIEIISVTEKFRKDRGLQDHQT
jgi:hypothetical protein